MRLFLVQHGNAVPKDIDPERPLGDRGQQDVDQVAAFLARAGVRMTAIFHSGKKRAQQTADIMANRITGAPPPGTISGIDPLDPVEAFVPRIDEWMSDTMVVGHLPFMGKLVSRLVAGNEAGAVVAFRPGTVMCLEREEDEGWSVAWMIRPELVQDGHGNAR